MLSNNNNCELIVSFTSFPARIKNVYLVIENLFAQTKKVDRIVLNLAKDEFLNGEKDLPESLLAFVGKGLEINWVSKNLKPYNKLLPTLKKYPDAVIVTVDDDVLYSFDWLEKLWNEYLKNPLIIHTHRAHGILLNKCGDVRKYKEWEWAIEKKEPSFFNFLTGVCGVLYPPRSLYKDVFDEELIAKLSPNADDVWFWAMAVLQGTKIKLVDNGMRQPFGEIQNDGGRLVILNVWQGGNDVQIQDVVNYYPELLMKLRQEQPKFGFFRKWYSLQRVYYNFGSFEIHFDKKARLLGKGNFPNGERRLYLFWISVFTYYNKKKKFIK